MTMERGRAELSSKGVVATVFTCLIALPILLITICKPTATFDTLLAGFSKATLSDAFPSSSSSPAGSEKAPSDKLLGGLLAPEFDEGTCISRYQSYLYRRPSTNSPSPHLLSKLRQYETLHKQCGPNTILYNATLELLINSTHSQTNATTSSCNYIVWLPSNGLGNRIISMASAFLYAVLTNRVLLVHHGTDMAHLFCEPFPNTTWFLTPDFPLTKQFDSREMRDVHSFGNLLKNNNFSTTSPVLLLRPFLYLYLSFDYDKNDKLFYLDENQRFLKNVPWLILRTDQYFVPSLFSLPSFMTQLDELFPDKETVFHHLVRYLFHPSNQAWGLITRFYQAYLADADERIGLQIRVFQPKESPSNRVMDQILACTKAEKLLPQLDNKTLDPSTSKNRTRKAVLITSLFPEYYENLKNMYWMRPSETGEVVGIYQPSHEDYQHFGDNMHNIKAWSEIYLLSLSDVLVTSSWSTFGYVAQGLGGLKPWILFMPFKQHTPDPACPRAISMEPCFHYPPTHDRKTGTSLDDAKPLPPHVRHCKDVGFGLKLVNNIEHP